MARATTDMQLILYGIALNPVQCKISGIGTTVNTVKNSTLLFWGSAVDKADRSKLNYQII